MSVCCLSPKFDSKAGPATFFGDDEQVSRGRPRREIEFHQATGLGEILKTHLGNFWESRTRFRLPDGGMKLLSVLSARQRATGRGGLQWRPTQPQRPPHVRWLGQTDTVQ